MYDIILFRNMKINQKIWIIAAVLSFVVLTLLIVFEVRSPVLILGEPSFIELYGKNRIRSESFRSSLALFRYVKIVDVANNAGDDAIQIAIADASSRPFCVIFPFRFASAAAIYSEQNPNISVVVLAGRHSIENAPSSGQSGYFIYKTDIEADFYRAGRVAAALDMDNNGKTALFLERGLRLQAEQAFSRGINKQESQMETHFFSSFSDFYTISGFSCVVLAGAGFEYIDENHGIPVILFTWLDPSMLPVDVVMVIDDSPLAQAVHAVTLAAAGEKDGHIGSRFLILDKKRINWRIWRKINIDS